MGYLRGRFIFVEMCTRGGGYLNIDMGIIYVCLKGRRGNYHCIGGLIGEVDIYT